MAAIHHNTLKKAKSHRIELTVEDGEVVASQNGVRLASHLSGTVALQSALNRLGGDDVKEIKAEPGRARAKAKRPAKSSGPHEDAARADGWKPVKGGGFKQTDVDEEEGGTSEAASWRDLCDEQDIEVESEGRSIVKAKYRQLYRPHRNTNGDDLAQQLREYLETEDQDGNVGIDADKLARFAKANDCWVESYASLANVGQQRMNVGNRLRAKVRKDPEYAIKWPK